jgi:hypothetical protein
LIQSVWYERGRIQWLKQLLIPTEALGRSCPSNVCFTRLQDAPRFSAPTKPFCHQEEGAMSSCFGHLTSCAWQGIMDPNAMRHDSDPACASLHHRHTNTSLRARNPAAEPAVGLASEHSTSLPGGNLPLCLVRPSVTGLRFRSESSESLL